MRRASLAAGFAGQLAVLLILVGSSRPAGAVQARFLIPAASGRNVSGDVVARFRTAVVRQLSAQCPRCLIIDRERWPQAAPLDAATAFGLGLQYGVNAVIGADIEHRPGATRFALLAYLGGPAPDTFPPLVVDTTTPAGPEVLWSVARELVERLCAQLAIVGHNSGAYDMEVRAGGVPATPRTVFFGAGVGAVAQFDTAGGGTELLPALRLFVSLRGKSTMGELRFELAERDVVERKTLGFSYAVREGPRLFLGAAAAWAWLNLGGRGANGVAVEPLIGYLYDVSGGPTLQLELGYAINLFQEQQMDRLIPGSDARHWSHGPMLLLGMAL